MTPPSKDEVPRLPNPAYNNTIARIYDDGHQKITPTGKARSDYILDCEGMFYVTFELDQGD